MKTFRASLIVPLFGLLASLAACSGQAPTDGTGSTSSSVTIPSEQSNVARPEHFGMRMGHGPASLIFAALHEPINLSAEQRTTIEASLATLKPQAQKKPENDARKSALVAAIRNNTVKIDEPAVKLEPKTEEHAAREASLVKALTTLHDTLSSEQRTLLVAAIEKRTAEGPKNFGNHKGNKGEHKNLEGKHAGGFGPMRMLDGLDLTKEQTDAIQSKLAENKPAKPTEAEREAMKARHEAMKKEMSARLQTFVGDNFDAKAFVAKPENAMPKMAHEGGNRMLKDLAVIVPILTVEQREKLATKIEQGPHARHAKKSHKSIKSIKAK